MEHLKALCDVLGLTLDEAAKGTADQAATAKEQAMLAVMRRISDSDTDILLAIANRMESKAE